ncbi:DeoR family transcriptional regulator [Lactobacillus sp. R2/2]|nr:DeoR family transcriptional regulator [Lactobacillus sp. R2/2]MEB3364651.1 DeoR family transcriptional regulator [Lactobacillus sp. R2/2]
MRKDLTFLDQKGYIIKEHGGATALNSLIENSFTVRQEKQIKLKN